MDPILVLKRLPLKPSDHIRIKDGNVLVELENNKTTTVYKVLDDETTLVQPSVNNKNKARKECKCSFQNPECETLISLFFKYKSCNSCYKPESTEVLNFHLERNLVNDEKVSVDLNLPQARNMVCVTKTEPKIENFDHIQGVDQKIPKNLEQTSQIEKKLPKTHKCSVSKSKPEVKNCTVSIQRIYQEIQGQLSQTSQIQQNFPKTRECSVLIHRIEHTERFLQNFGLQFSHIVKNKLKEEKIERQFQRKAKLNCSSAITHYYDKV